MICERVIIIHEGQIVAVDRPENLATRLRGVERIEIDARGPSREIATALEGVSGVESVDHRYSQDGGHSTFIVGTNPESEPRSTLAQTVLGGGWELLRLQSIGMSLEEIFLQVTTEEIIPDPIPEEEAAS